MSFEKLIHTLACRGYKYWFTNEEIQFSKPLEESLRKHVAIHWQRLFNLWIKTRVIGYPAWILDESYSQVLAFAKMSGRRTDLFKFRDGTVALVFHDKRPGELAGYLEKLRIEVFKVEGRYHGLSLN